MNKWNPKWLLSWNIYLRVVLVVHIHSLFIFMAKQWIHHIVFVNLSNNEYLVVSTLSLL